MDEKEAIERLLKRDLEGLAWLMEKHQVRALRASVLITHDRDLAEDVVQTKFIDLYRNIRSFDPSRQFAPWFLRSVVNASISAARVSGKADMSGNTEFDPETWMDSEPLPETKAMQAEFDKRVQDSMNRLSPEQRAVVVMRYFLEMSEAEIAETARIPRGTIKWRLHAARRRLRSLLSFSQEKEERYGKE